MSLLFASLALLSPLAPCEETPAYQDASDLSSPAPIEAAGNGLWIAGVRFKGTDIVAAAVDQDSPSSAWAVDVMLSRSGKAKFDSIQGCRVNRLVEVSFDRTAVARPNLVARIDGNVFRIAGNFTHEGASRLAYQISNFR